MTLHRLDWPSAVSRGATVVRVVLLAGWPYALVADGVEVAGVVWTDDSDPAWHVGTSPSVLPWLLVGEGAPALAWEENASPVRATLDVGSLRVEIADPTHDLVGATTAFSSRDTAPYTRLTATASASDTSITVESTAAFPSSGVIHVGRERITYASTTSTTFDGCTRGTEGSTARAYLAGDAVVRVYGQPAGASVEALPTLVGRRATVWVAELDTLGCLVDPTLVFDGRVDTGVGVSPERAVYTLPIRHAIHVLAAEATAPTLALYGYEHGTNARAIGETVIGSYHGSPLWYQWTDRASAAEYFTLGSADGPPDYGGWSSSRELYLDRWNAAARAGGYGARATLLASGEVVVRATDLVTDRRLSVWQGWSETLRSDPDGETVTRESVAVYSAGAMPESCFWLTGILHLDATALAQVPPVPASPAYSATVDGAPDVVFAQWTLSATREGDGESDAVTSRIAAVTAASGDSVGYVTLAPVVAPPSRTGPSLLPWVFTTPTVASLGLNARGSRWWSTLRYGVLAQIDALRGLDAIADSIDWTRLVEVVEAHQVHPTRRDYVVDLARPPLDLLRNEALLAGLALSTWHGRVAVCAIRDVAQTEGTDATLTAAHLREAPSQSEVSDGLATSYRVTLETGAPITVTDAGAVAESGAGETLSATMPRGVLPARALGDPTVTTAILTVGTAILAPWVRPYQVIQWPGDLRLAGLQIGAVVTLSEWLLPDQRGGRGITDAAATVVGRRVDLDAGTVDLRLRLSPSAVSGYAPEALVASIDGMTLTLDTTTLGVEGFAQPGTLDGGASTFTVGDAVLLLELDTTTPATPFAATVTAVVGATVSLDSAPGPAWATRASSGLVLLAFAPHADATASQHRWAYVTDGTSYLYPDGSPGRRWS